jgi:hypothetical protein
MSETVDWGTIQGTPITFPMEVDRYHAATMGFSVPADVATSLLPGDAFVVTELEPGRAQLLISLCDYRENPWGDYNEVNIGFLARPADAEPDVLGSFIYRMPVDQEFTCEAGNKVMGFPKVVTRIDAEYTDERVTFRLWDDGVVALTVSVPRVESVESDERSVSSSYSYLDGVPYATPLAIDMTSGPVPADDVELVLGDGPIADELRRLGLPTAPNYCTWGENLSASFQLGQPV